MNRRPHVLDPDLFAWLVLEHEPVAGWAPDPPADALQCSPDLVARLALVARPVGDVRRRFVAGCPVVHHPGGRAIAVAAGTSWVAVRSRLPAGSLRRAEPPVPQLRESEPALSESGWPALCESGWRELDPWAADTAFARAVDLLRAHVADAYAWAESEPDRGSGS